MFAAGFFPSAEFESDLEGELELSMISVGTRDKKWSVQNCSRGRKHLCRWRLSVSTPGFFLPLPPTFDKMIMMALWKQSNLEINVIIMNSYWDKDLIRTSFWLCWALSTFILSPKHNREDWPLVGRRCLPLAQFANLQLPVEVIRKSVRPSWRCDTATTASTGTALLVLEVETTWPLDHILLFLCFCGLFEMRWVHKLSCLVM